MTLTYQPPVGSVVMCDFHGYQAPEIIKKRPVVVIARHRDNRQLLTVVPISTTAPCPIRNYHYSFPTNPLPDKPHIPCWAKCDLVATVSLARLDRYKPSGGTRCVPRINATELLAIRQAVAYALNL